MRASPIKFVRIRKGPVLTQKSEDSNGILVIVEIEIGWSLISPLNLFKIALESALFWVKTGPFIIRTYIIGDAHISNLRDI